MPLQEITVFVKPQIGICREQSEANVILDGWLNAPEQSLRGKIAIRGRRTGYLSIAFGGNNPPAYG